MGQAPTPPGNIGKSARTMLASLYTPHLRHTGNVYMETTKILIQNEISENVLLPINCTPPWSLGQSEGPLLMIEY